jgi:hypothetical protein
VNSETTGISIAKMISPLGCREPGQTPEFDEYTVVLKGELQVETGIALTRFWPGKRSSSTPASGHATARRAIAGKSPSADSPRR